uniref:Natural cytotoxicity triggering receptor 3 n=1 Tax=Leptobrachium leishanense TaxID=445787 RepID=A0A8C5WCZ8_9ANUR
MMEGLIFVLVALQGVHSQSLQVSQSPMVNTKEGDSVTLECNYTINNETIGWYKWYRHQLHGDEVSNNTGYYKGRVSMASPSDFTEKASASITLHNVSITDTGMYICEVNINEMISGHGNGTFFKVSEREYENAESGIGKVRNVVRGLGYYIFLSIGLVTVITGVIIYMCHSKTDSTYSRQDFTDLYTYATSQ